MTLEQRLFALAPDYRERVWGGSRLGKGADDRGLAAVVDDARVATQNERGGTRTPDDRGLAAAIGEGSVASEGSGLVPDAYDRGRAAAIVEAPPASEATPLGTDTGDRGAAQAVAEARPASETTHLGTRAADPPPHAAPIGEAWIAFEGSRVQNGPAAGQTVRDLVATDGRDLVGEATLRRSGGRFPLLIKLLDTADWLSVQVHPNDDQAKTMVGPSEFGKTEAWYFLEADPGARILAGVNPGVSRERVRAAVRDGSLLEVAADMPVHAGEAMLVPAGMLHALGPGLLLYEVQQSSDTTYRAYDWGRPETPQRRLHIEECAAVLEAHEAALRKVSHNAGPVDICRVVESVYFEVDSIWLPPGVAPFSTGGSFHLLTVAGGSAVIATGDETIELGRFGTALVAACTGDYEIRSSGNVQIVRSQVPVAAD